MRMVTIPRQQIEQAVNAVLPGFPEIAGAYLFGSALGECRPNSDIDLGLIVDPGLHKPGLYGHALEGLVEAQLPNILGHRFDVVTLKPSAVLLSFRVISTGKLIYVANAGLVTDFIELVSRRYPDVYRRYRIALREALS